MGGGSKSSSSQSTSATQNSSNADNGSVSLSGVSVGKKGSLDLEINDLSATSKNGIAIGGGSQITVNDLSAEVAGDALKLGGKAVDGGFDLAERLGMGAFDLSKQTTGTAFDFLNNSGEMLVEYIENQSQRTKTENLNNQELTASLSRAAFDLANEKTASADDKVFSFGRMALYVLGGLAGLFILAQLIKRPKA